MTLHFPPRSNVSKFRHRENPDGYWDSICLKCLRTVARARTEEMVAREEQEHVCSSSPTFSGRNGIPASHVIPFPMAETEPLYF